MIPSQLCREIINTVLRRTEARHRFRISTIPAVRPAEVISEHPGVLDRMHPQGIIQQPRTAVQVDESVVDGSAAFTIYNASANFDGLVDLVSVDDLAVV